MVTAEENAPVHIDPSELGRFELEDLELPYVDMIDEPAMRSKLTLYGTEYDYVRSFPIKGHSAIMPAFIRELVGQDKRLLVAERQERYYVYVA
jgi:hypothetical protein